MIYEVSLYSLRTLSNCLSPSPPHPPYDSTISPFENNLSHVLKFFLHLCFLYFQSLPFSLFPSLFLSLSHYTQFLFPRLYGFFLNHCLSICLVFSYFFASIRFWHSLFPPPPPPPLSLSLLNFPHPSHSNFCVSSEYISYSFAHISALSS